MKKPAPPPAEPADDKAAWGMSSARDWSLAQLEFAHHTALQRALGGAAQFFME